MNTNTLNKNELTELLFSKINFANLPDACEPKLNSQLVAKVFIKGLMRQNSPETIAQTLFKKLPKRLETAQNQQDILKFVQTTLRRINNPAMPVREIAGLSLEGASDIKKHEGFSAQLYNDQAGHATIGYGHLVHKGKINGTESEEFKTGITTERADELFQHDIKSAENAVRRLVTVDLTQNQFDALTSFVFNLGESKVKKATLFKKLNTGDYAGAQNEILRWNKVHIPGTDKYKESAGLTKRRQAEARLFSGE